MPVGERFELVREYEVRFSDPAIPYEIEMEVRVEDGAPRCHELRVSRREGGPPITGEGLRRLPLGRILERAAPLAARVRTGRKRGPVVRTVRTHDDIRDFYAEWRLSKHRRPRSVDDELLRRVAEVYRAAQRRGDPPTATVAQVLHGSRSSAGRWVMLARERGFLGPALDRKAGERTQRKGGAK